MNKTYSFPGIKESSFITLVYISNTHIFQKLRLWAGRSRKWFQFIKYVIETQKKNKQTNNINFYKNSYIFINTDLHRNQDKISTLNMVIILVVTCFLVFISFALTAACYRLVEKTKRKENKKKNKRIIAVSHFVQCPKLKQQST